MHKASKESFWLTRRGAWVTTLHVEYAERRRKYGIIFIFSPLYEYSNLDYVRVPVIHRVHQAESVIHMRVAASQEYVNVYSTRRVKTWGGSSSRVQQIRIGGGVLRDRNRRGVRR